MKESSYTNWKLFALSGLALSGPVLALEHGTVEITQLNATNNGLGSGSPAVSVAPGTGGTAGWTIAGANRGDTDMSFGAGSDDLLNGMLLTCATENARNNFAGGDTINGLNFATTSIAAGGAGYFVPTHDMGGSAEDIGGRAEYNINFAFGYFPYGDFIGAHVDQTANGGALNGLRATPGIVLGQEINDNGNGVFGIDLTDLQTPGPNPVQANAANGVLIAVHGKNEGNFTLVQDKPDGTFQISIMDNGEFGGGLSYEQDTFGFVYFPTNLAGPDLITAIGRVEGDGSSEVSGGTYTVNPRRSLTSLGSVVASGAFESAGVDAEAAFTSQLADLSGDTYLVEILSGPDSGTFVEINGVTSDTELTLASSLTTTAGDYPVDYRIGKAGHEYVLEIAGKNPGNGTLLVSPEGGSSEAAEVEVTTGAFEAELQDNEATFLSSLADSALDYQLEITSGADAGTVVDITGVNDDTTLAIDGVLTETDYSTPVTYRVFVVSLPGNTDNFVTYQWSEADSAYIVQSRDVPDGFITEAGEADEDIFSFVFLTSDPANAQPVVTIDSPVSGSQVTLGSTLNISATATDEAPGSIASVEFFFNGVSQGLDTTAPYEISSAGPFNNLENIVIGAIATDSDGARTTAAPVNVSIVPPAGAGGLYFNGIDQYATFGNAAALQLATFTIETWFKPEGNFGESTNTGGVTAIPLVTKGREQGNQSNTDMNFFLGIRESDGVLVADFEDSNLGQNVPIAGRTPVATDEWQHAAVTFDGIRWALYLNGNLESTLDAGGLVPRMDSIQHAALASALNSNGTPDGFFQGFIDEARVWNVARTQSQIRQTCNFEITSQSGLVARWGINEASGATIASSAGAPLTGDLIGNPVWAAGNVFTNNVKPDLAITSPEPDFQTTLGTTVTITASASDPDGSIANVEFFVNGVSLAVDTTSPYSATLDASTPEPRAITVVATDNAGETSIEYLNVDVILPAPTVAGYTVGVIDGGSLDIDTPDYTPAPDGTFTWAVESSSASPAFTGSSDANRGDLNILINGARISKNTGMLLGTNHPTLENLASLDNSIAPDADGANYYVSVVDNEGPGAADPATPEESGRLSLGFFPWANGWYGAEVTFDGSFLNTQNFPAEATVTVTNPDDGIYELSGLPTVGNIIANSFDNGNDNVVGIGQSGGKWIVTSRDNSGTLENEEFGFLYIPTRTPGVYSGLVRNDGTLVPLNDELALVGGSVNPGAQGYELVIGDGSVINPSNSIIIVTADIDNGNGGDNVYSYFANGNSFVIFSQDLPDLTSQFQQGGFRFLVAPLDPVVPADGDVVIVATDPSATEGTDTASFTFVRYGDTSQELTVSFTASGAAMPGVDFAILPGSVTFPAGSDRTTLEVNALADGFLELTEDLVLSIQPGAGYQAGAYSSATVFITNVNPTVATTRVSFQEGVGGYTGQWDKRVGEDGTNQLGSTVQNYYLDGRPENSSPDINGLVRFDNIFGNGPGQIPPGAGIQDAQLVMTTSNAADAQSGGPYIIDRLVVPVTDTTTYEELQVGNLGGGFEGVRGSSSGLPVAGFGAIANSQVVTANVTFLVQQWSSHLVDSFYDAPNYGFAIYTGGTTDGWSYCTVGNNNPELRPKLVVTYTTDNTLKDYYYEADLNSIINNQQGSNNQTTPSLDGSTIKSQFLDLNDPNAGTTEALVRFPITFGNPDDLNSIPDGETVVKAELLLTTDSPVFGGSTNAQSSGPFAIHQMLVDWDVTTTFGLTGPLIGTEIEEAATRIVGMGQLSATYGDITSMIQNWRAGAPNYGLNVKPETTDGWAPFWLGAPVDNPGLIDAVPLLRVTTAILEASDFDNYMSANGAAGANFLDDRDRDGVVALLEYALGLDPRSLDILPRLVADGNDFTLTFQKGTEAAADARLTYAIETSTDLITWLEVTPDVNDANQISATIPGPAPGQPKVFARIKVDYN